MPDMPHITRYLAINKHSPAPTSNTSSERSTSHHPIIHHRRRQRAHPNPDPPHSGPSSGPHVATTGLTPRTHLSVGVLGRSPRSGQLTAFSLVTALPDMRRFYTFCPIRSVARSRDVRYCHVMHIVRTFSRSDRLGDVVHVIVLTLYICWV